MKKKKYPKLEDYDLSDYIELTGDILYKINGGAQIENSNEAVANAQVGDSLTRKNGTVVEITQGDIDWAREQVGTGGNTGNSGAEDVNIVTGNSSVGTGSNPGSSGNSGSSNYSSSNTSSNSSDSYTSGTTSSPTSSSSNSSTNQNYTPALNHQQQYEMAKADEERKKNSAESNFATVNDENYTKIDKTFCERAPVFSISEGVGIGASTIKVNCYTDSDGRLNVSALGLYSGKNNISVDSYHFGGNVTLIVNGEKKESKNLYKPEYSFLYDGTYDYIGTASFETNFNYNDKIEILSDIGLVVNNGYVYSKNCKYNLR